MLRILGNAFAIPEIRRKIAFTAAMLALYRLGAFIPAPGIESSAIEDLQNNFAGSDILGFLNLFSGGSLSRLSLFALGIMPYITASIILQLLTVVVPTLERLQKEGESGYAKINQYTRYLTVALAGMQSIGYTYLFKRQGALEASTARVILTVLPTGINAWVNGGPVEKIMFPLIALGVIVAVVFVQEGQRRIPIQYAKRMVGRRMTTGGSTYMPLRVNMAGVIPVIFAAAIMAFPPTIGSFFPQTQEFVNSYFTPNNLPYLLFQAFLIVIFTYFYTAVQFNPVDQADNLRKHGGYIPGIRPGPPTAQYLDRVLTRLTLPGSLFLAVVAVAPSLFIRYFGFSQATSRALGGTSVLIAVGVALDTMRQMESQMMMRNYEGFLR